MASLIAAPYRNAGNDLVLSMVPPSARHILDVGCGAGDNARRIREKRPDARIVGITHSKEEADLAAAHFEKMFVGDLETLDIGTLDGPFDLLVFSHVLEHMRDPVQIVRRLLPLLAPAGHVLVAVPNTLEWRSRSALLRGRFDYAAHGIFDRTHLRFFTFDSAPRELIAPLPELVLLEQRGDGAAPLGPLRTRLLPAPLRARIDALAVRRYPNLFARETAMLAQLRTVQQ